MTKDEIIEILHDWNLWRKDLNVGIPRPEYQDRVNRFLKTNLVLTITGPRRAGKSVIMRQTATALTEKGVEKANILIVNLEDPRFTEQDVRLLTHIYETYLSYLNPKGQIYVLLDEVQGIEKWEKWVGSMHELGKAKLIVSGSNAKLLSRELGTLLTGRHLDITVFTLSFREFLEFNKLIIRDKLDVIANRIEISGLLNRYLEFGAFPEVALSEEKKELLLNYFEDLVNKDVLRRFQIRKTLELRALIKFYLSNTATLTTFTSLERFLKISASTIEKFSGYLEQAYLVFFLKRFSFKVREQEKSPRKVYAVDTGLSNVAGFRFSAKAGRLAENAVFLELKRRQAFRPEMELYYWKDIHHREVDFVIKEGMAVRQLIQVCWNMEDMKTRDRETRSLLKAMAELKTDEALIITEDEEAVQETEGRTIKVIPLWKWLLQL